MHIDRADAVTDGDRLNGRDRGEDATIGVSHDQVVVDWGAGAERLLGFARAEIVGQSLRSLVASSRAEGGDAVLASVLHASPGAALALKLTAKDGRWLDVRATVSPLTGPAGRGGVALKLRVLDDQDTERWRHLTSEAVATLLPDTAIVIVDAHGVVTSWSAGAERLYGYRAEDIVGLPAVILLPHPTFELADLRATVGRGRPYERSATTRRRKDGTLIAVSAKAVPVQDTDGTLVGFAATTRLVPDDATGRRHSRRSQQRARLILDTAPEAFVSMDASGLIVDWNPASEAMFGWSRAEAIGRHLSASIMPPRYRAAHEEGLRRFLETGEGRLLGRRFEIHALHRNGREFPVELAISAAHIDGEPVFHAFVRDITERREALATQSRLAALVESSDDAIVGEATDGTITSWNPAAERLYGYTAAEALGRPANMLVPEEHRAGERSMRADVLQGGAVSNHSTRRLTREGRSVDVSISVSPIRDAEGTNIGISTIARDVTESRRVARALREAQERFEFAFASAPVGVALLTPDGRFLEVNQSLCEIAGRSEEELLGADTAPTVHPDDRPLEREGRRRLTSGELERHTIEKRFVRPDGEEIWVLCSTALVSDATAAPRYFVTQVQDIDARKRAEEDLRTSERMMAEAQARARVGSWGYDVLTGEVWASAELQRIWGLPPERPLLSFEELLATVHPDDRDALSVQLQRALAGSNPYEARFRVIRPDGSTRIIESRGEVTFDAAGRAVALGGLSQDVTERREAEEALERLSRRNEAILLAAGEGIVGLDEQGRMTFANPAAARLTGWMVEEMLGRELHALVHHSRPDRSPYPASECPIQQVLHDGATQHADEVFWRKDGTPFAVECISTPIRDGARVVGAAVSFTDISERRRGEEEFRRLSVRNEVILASAAEGIIGLDARGRAVFVNPEAARMLGWTAAEMLGRQKHEAIHHSREDGAHYPANECPTSSVLRDGVARSVDDEVFWTKEGESFPVEYISAPIKDEERVVGAVVTFRDITERRRIEAQLQHLADHDGLTGLFNRRRFEEELERQVAVARRRGGGGALLLLDLDEFKDINDSLGHMAGDELLKRVAALLRERTRATDVLCRLGGDEFGLLLPDADSDQARAAAHQLLDVMRAAEPVGERTMRVTTSIGIAMLEGDRESTASDLLVRADLTLYQAKESGRDRVAFYSSARHAQVDARVSQVQRIRRALEQDLFVLHAQPIVELATNRVARHELLLRMSDGQGRVVAPSAFLSTAERLGLVGEIDRWVVDRAVALIAEQERARRPVCLEVNLSGRSLSDPQLLAFIEAELVKTSIDPSCLIFEITETAAIGNMEQARHLATTLARLGCRFALDDFGTGFASYYHLKYLPVDSLKIDGDFIGTIAHSRTDQLVVEAIVQVARGLGKETIAEGIEDAETLRLVRDYGVTYGQGYHLGRPGPVEDVLGSDVPPGRRPRRSP